MEATDRHSGRQLLSGDGVTVRELQYLVALADTMHFGKAASACRVTQPTLSVQLRKLEQRVGGPLVMRTRTGPVLTSLGQEAVARARRVLDEVLQINDLGLAHPGAPDRPVRIGLATSVAPYVAPRLLAALAHRRLVLHEAPASALPGCLNSGEVDVTVSLVQRDDKTPFQQRVLGADSLMVAVPQAHPMAAARTVSPAELHALPLIVPLDVPSPQRLGLWRDLAELGNRSSLDWPGNGATQLSALALVQTGHWCSLLTGLAARAQAMPAGVALRQVLPLPQPLSVSMRWLPNTPASVALQQLVPALESACALDGE